MKTFYPIPPTSTPDDTVCVILRVPNSPQWLGALWWILDQYSYWFNWQRTDDKRGRFAAMRWRQMFWEALAENNGASVCPADILAQIGIQLEDDISMNIRKNPDNPCIIQMWCIDHWEDWYDPLSCVGNAIKQPTNGTAIAAGECREWDVSLRASEKWLLPIAVDAGDIITVTGATGGWNDGGIVWNCVNGHTYAFGACVSSDAANPGDPLMTVDHMRLIMSIDTVFTDAYNVETAVADGVSAAQVFFQANDSELSDNSGTISFHVKVCKPVAAPSAIAVTYDYGSGISSLTLAPGEERIITFTATAIPGYVNNWGVNIHFDTPLVISVLAETGFVNMSSGVVFSAIYNPYPTLVHQLIAPGDPDLLSMPPNLTGQLYGGATGSGGAVFTVTLKLRLP